MTGPIQFNMPVEQEEQYESDRSTYTPSVSIYKPLPNKAGERFVNELFVPLYDPTTWKIFNMSPEERSILGLTDSNPIAPINEAEQPLYTFYFKVPVHAVQEFVREDGSTGFANIICPKHFNAYLTKAMGRRPLFKEDKCAFCEASDEGWSDYNSRWNELEQQLGIKKKELSADARRKKGEEDPILKEAYERAKKYKAQEKCLVNVFDLGKFRGNRPMEDEGETLAYQIYFAPKTVFNHLREQWVEDSKEGQLPFFSFYNPQGLQIVKLIKSTEKCKGKNLRDTEYNVMKGSVMAMDDGWLNYLKSLENMVDPSELLHIVSYADMQLYTQPEESYNKPAETPNQVTPPAQVPAAQPPQQAAPPAQVPAAQPPQQAPQAAPPSAPPAAPPQAAPPAQVPQAAPPATPPAMPPQAAPPATPPMMPPAQAPQAAPPAQVPPSMPSQMPQAAPQAAPPAMPPQMPSQVQQAPQNPPTVTGGVPPVQAADAQGVPTQIPDRTPPANTPPGSNFSW